MFAIVQNNEIVKTSGSIRALFPNISFPASGPSAEFKATHNVMEIVEGEQKDQRFYWVTPAGLELVNGIPTRIYTNTPKQLEDREEVDAQGNPMYVQVLSDVDGEMVNSSERLVTKGLKSQWIAQVKSAANSQLAPTDWYVIRKAERGVEIPAEVVAARQAILTECNAKETAILACTTVEELMAAV